MPNIARLLFGPEGDKLLDLLTPDSRRERDLTDQVREAGEWCQSTPGSGSLGVERRGGHGQPVICPRRGRG
jgi:hypothetical protein